MPFPPPAGDPGLSAGEGGLGQTFGGCFGCLWPKTTGVVEKCFLGQSREISESLKLLFNLFCGLKSTLPTRHAAGKAANTDILQLLGGFGGEISQKSPAAVSPSLPTAPPVAMGQSPLLRYLGFPVMETGAALAPQTLGTPQGLFQRVFLRSFKISDFLWSEHPLILALGSCRRRWGGHSSPLQEMGWMPGRGVWALPR